MMTEIEWMLMMLRRNPGSRAVTSAFPNLPEGPRNDRADIEDANRRKWTCPYCGTASIECADFACAVQRVERPVKP